MHGSRSFRGYEGHDPMTWRHPWRARRHAAWGDHGGAGRFYGLDAEEMSPGARVSASLAVLAPAVLVAALVLTQAPWLFWLFFVFGWAVFPAFGMFVRGVAEMAERRRVAPRPAKSKERELLEALREHGELTPARAAMETSLAVAEADEMLKGLAEGGHLDVRVRGGGLFYALWAIEATPRELGETDRTLEKAE